MNPLPEFEIGALAYVGVFIGVLLAFEGFRQILSRRESRAEARNRRMRLIAAGATTEERLSLLKPRHDAWRLSGLPLIGTLPSELARAGMTIRPELFVALSASAAAILGLAASTVMDPLVAGLVAVTLAVAVPVLWVRARRKKRMNALVAQLPDALDLMARGLTVGHPLNATIASVAQDMKDPVAMEFGIIVDQIAYGEDLPEAVMDFADRTDLEDTRYLAVSIAIQHGTGGDLARVLMTLSKVIRDRLTMRQRIKAISAEGRLTSVFLSSLPIVILTSTMVSSPDYYAGVSDDPLFRPFAIIVGTLVIANYLTMRKLVNFRF
ncbi:MAG: type II secretion system F family protein [Albidovulum sp.]|uniref:type II secretion system F family protein n=1 Tax=Albidovulum sp. TaxID=1872424 RepID=UPI001325C339|nr:type II secretion system F family protein [Defluviimonas sp.]KAB2883630.1 MAG: type II secretion system F family protein [Defluviimonas sp.]